MYKEELILLSLQAFPFWNDLMLWDSSCKDMTGIKGLLFFCIHLTNHGNFTYVIICKQLFILSLFILGNS
jgi:hypothetical protein